MNYEHLGPLHDMFRRQAALTPDKHAIVSDDGRKLTYKELDEATDTLAQYLILKGTVADSIVGVYMERCVEFTISYIAILKAGAAYMPLDVTYPLSLLASVFEDATPKAVLTLPSVKDVLPEVEFPLITLGDGWLETIRNELKEAGRVLETPRISLDNLAYTVYSSGTTGKPKGIQCPHRGSVFSYTWRHNEYPYSDEDNREACNVFFVWEMLRPLLKGATLFIIPDNVIYDPILLAQYFKRHAITRMLFTPSLFEAVINAENIDLQSAMKSFKQLWFCGEVVTTALLERCCKILPWIQFVNLYSISECHDVAAADLSYCYKHQSEAMKERKFCPVGRVLPDVKVVIMSADMVAQPIGASGEIYVGGPTLARGYLNRPKLNGERFVSLKPAAGQTEQRYYRTGDWGYMLADGSLEICGRCDSMVKVRGYSIEIQAVEAALISLPMVNAAVVLVNGEEGDDKFLIAYIVPEGETSKKDVRANLKRLLPFYMIPSYFIFIQSIPVLPASSKLDKKALPTLDTSSEQTVDEDGKPKTNNEKVMVDIWKEILQLKCVDTMESFFDLGGHSLLAAKLLSKTKQLFGVDVTVRELFVHSTISQLASLIEKKMQPDNKPSSPEPSPSIDLVNEVEVHDQFINSTVNSVRIDMQLRAFWRSVSYGNRWKKGRVLLTGVTGFLGAFILRELLLETQTHVYCLVRSQPDRKVLDRLKQALRQYGIIASVTEKADARQANVLVELENRVSCLKGDITLLNLGLSEEDHQHFSTEIDFIIHPAANVNLIYPYQALHGPNVIGTQNVILFASTNKIKPLHYVSTDAVFPHGLKNCSENDDVSQLYGQLEDGYSQSKWVAEQLVLRARARGVPVVIYRPGNMSGDSKTAHWNPADFNLMMIKACLETGSAPQIDWQVEMTPVDFAAKAIVMLTQNIMLSLGKTFHIANDDPLHASWLFEWLMAHGYKLQILPYTKWLENLRQHSKSKGDLSTLQRVLENLVTDETFFANLSTYKNDNLRAVLSELNMTYPATDPSLLANYFQKLSKHHVIPAPKRIDFGERLLEGKVAIVTGSSSGIGASIAIHLARAGARVALAARRDDLLRQLSDTIQREDGVSICVKTDVTDKLQVKELIRHVESTLGPVDVIVNNAGVMYYTMMKNLHENEWEKQIDINCKGVVNMVGAAIDGMLTRKSGHIVNMSSNAGRRGFAGLAVYSGTKFFVEGFSQALRQEVSGSGIRVTCIQPGDVKTELLTHTTDAEAKSQYDGSEQCKILDPDDIGRAVVYAVSQPGHVGLNEILIEPREAPI
ncbi:uncharacterized protein LOC141905204 [Tubulanus polymorphus]|uniref:uncharacterized protein LOC141905204 n=1 Tax=Tubulanus polymorphus TaxID=672921 RepID=UPI003DA603E5